ncbi:MAG: AhpC/TSA family protein [Chlorobi bacterium]|nr:AhpC/TSA family protein [Chlorobiota bacterium]
MKIKLKKTLVNIILITVTATITSNAQKATLKGQVINNTKYTKIELQDLSYKTLETQKLDKKGKFKFNTEFDKFNFYILVLDKQNFTVFFPEPGEQAEIIINADNIRNPEIKNSEQTKIYYEYSKKFSEIKNNKDKIEFIKKMIDDNPSSPVCIFFIDNLNPKTDYEYFKKLADGLKKYKYNPIVNEFITKTENIKKLEPGKEAPDIALPDPDGNIIKLSSLRGKYVLIDFWASWCRPCRAENPNNVKLYQKYRDKGFEIYGVSLDKDKNSWIKAIENDKLTWTQVSDLKFWQSEGAKIYNVKAIPHTVLLDKEGKIIATGLRGHNLSQKLKEIFGY